MEHTTTTLFVHGVGMWPGLFTPLVERSGGRSLCWVRPGYCHTTPAANLEEQVDLLEDAIAESAPAVLVGVSGGATLALAAALRSPLGLEAIITHEPLLGPLAPALNAQVRAAGAALRAQPDAASVWDFLDGLYGFGAIEACAPEAQAFVQDHLQVIAHEVADFAEFAPERSALEAMRAPHLTTVGSRSSERRHQVAALLASVGASRTVIADAGHLVLADAPVAFADAITAFLTEVAS